MTVPSASPWMVRYRDLGPDAEVFWGGRAVEGQVVATETDIEEVLRLAAECDDTVDRSDDAPRGATGDVFV